MLDAGAKKLQRRLFAKGAGRAQVGYAHRRLERQTGRHDFAPDGLHMFALQWAGVGLLYFLDDCSHAIGPEEGRAFAALDLADFFSHAGALVQQREQLPVELVNLDAEFRQVGCHGSVPAQACSFSNSRM